MVSSSRDDGKAAGGRAKLRGGHEVAEWTTYTPDGRRLVVRRESDTWLAACGGRSEARSELLDVALIEAIRNDPDIIAHALGVDYGEWTREQADRTERDLHDAR